MNVFEAAAGEPARRFPGVRALLGVQQRRGDSWMDRRRTQICRAVGHRGHDAADNLICCTSDKSRGAPSVAIDRIVDLRFVDRGNTREAFDLGEVIWRGGKLGRTQAQPGELGINAGELLGQELRIEAPQLRS